MAFPVTKTLKLDYLGQGWEDAYLNLSGLSFKEMRIFAKMGAEFDKENPESDKNLDLTVELIEDHFIGGKAWNGSELVDLKKEDIPDLPVEVLTRAIQLLAGTDQNLAQT
jgi:hypothetical protein